MDSANFVYLKKIITNTRNNYETELHVPESLFGRIFSG